MPKMSDLEDYLKPYMVENGDILKLLDSGKIIPAKESRFDRSQFNIGVGLPDQRSKIWTLNKTTRDRLTVACARARRHGQIDYLDKSALLQGKSVVDVSYIVEADSAGFSIFVERAVELAKALSERSPPPAVQCWLCDYCLYREECREEGA